MQYIKVAWIHDHPEHPVLLYSELDASRWEVRKVEVFHDGTKGFASEETNSGRTMLGLAPVPPLSEIASDPEFEPNEIGQKEFEAVWSDAVKDQ